jgi:hypothetical protein
MTVFREIKMKIVAKFREISPKLSSNGKVTFHPKEKLGFYEDYDTLLLIKTKVILSISVF